MNKILAIDDKQDNLATIEAILKTQMQACEILLAQSGKEGIEIALNKQPDLVLLDIIMPGMDGFETCQRLKADERTKHIPVVMVTAIRSDSESRVKAMNLGADAFISKPIEPVELVAQVKVMLRIKAAEDRLKSENRNLELRVKERTSELEESEEKFRSIFNRVADAIFIFDPDTFKIIEANEATSKIYGYTSDELIGMSCLKFSSEVEKSKTVGKNIHHTGKDIVNFRHHKKKDGTDLFLKLQVYKMVVKNQPITFSVCHDITEAIKSENALIEAKEKAEESDRLKSAFLANMSHEIRTPMNGILGFTELLLEPDLSSEEKEEYINIVQQSGQRMLNTVKDLVEISKIEAGIVTVDLKQVNIQERIHELIRFFTPESTKKGLKLITEKKTPTSAVTIATDQNILDSVLTNLIKNAIKYTPAGEIRIGCEAKANNLELYVKDTGIGIPKERQQAVFERFVQGDITNSRQFEGSGLGLAISKSYVELLGGKIWVESREGKGSAFYFTLPLSGQDKEINEEKKNGKQNDKISQLKGMNIIIAEDDENSSFFLQTILKKESNKILLTKNGRETVEACRNNPDIDLILMDIQMPKMNGYDATREIRKFNNNVIIIAQTAFALTGDFEKAIKAGCNDYITKPINKKVLLHKIGNLELKNMMV